MKLHAPFRMIISGASHTGKTCLVEELIKNRNKFIDDPPNVIHYCAKFISAIPVSLKNIVNYQEGMVTEDFYEKYLKNERVLLVIDDMMSETSKNTFLSGMFMNSRHKNISIIYIQHNIFPNNQVSRDISLNCSYLIIMRNCRNPSQILTLSRQVNPLSPHSLARIYFTFINKAYAYLFCDFMVSTPDCLRYRSNIFSEKIEIFIDEFERIKLLNINNEHYKDIKILE